MPTERNANTPFMGAQIDLGVSYVIVIVMDFMILFLDSVCVGQFAKKNRSFLQSRLRASK